MKGARWIGTWSLFWLIGAGTAVVAQDCVPCHKKVTPGIVRDWEASVHKKEKVECYLCHGLKHKGMDDSALAWTVTAETCANCHKKQFAEFKKSKHALAWAAMKAMPTTHWKPMTLIDGMKGCGGWHKIGLKEPAEIERLKKEGSGFGFASCDACHTRHTFSVKEAREPEACASCHMGFDHAQWEMWSSSKHGVRHKLKRLGALPKEASAPTCQTCHMPSGNHDVHTAWGFLGVRTNGLAPYPGESKEWWADRVTILQALGVLDPTGKPTKRLDVVAAAQVAPLSAATFDEQRKKMIAVCGECHSDHFTLSELGKGDKIIQEADSVMAKAIRIVAALYKDGILAKPANYAYAFPDLLTFHDSPTPIDNRLFKMYLKHRMRTFQGAFHNSPDYSLWYGWSEMQMDLTEIRAMAAELRRKHKAK